MDRSRRSFPTAAGWFRARSRCRLACQNAADDAGPHAEEAAKPPSRSMRAHPSSSFETRTRVRSLPNVFDARAPQDEDEHRVVHSSRCQTAHLVLAARWRPRFATFASLTPNEGGRSAEKRSGAAAPVGRAHNAARQALARRLASHDAGRSPLGAPPWRFWAPGAALLSPAFAPDRLQRAPRTQVVVPGGRGPEPPGTSGYKPPPQDATPRSAFRFALENAPSMSEAGNGSSIASNCSQVKNAFCRRKKWTRAG